MLRSRIDLMIGRMSAINAFVLMGVWVFAIHHVLESASSDDLVDLLFSWYFSLWAGVLSTGLVVLIRMMITDIVRGL